MAKKILSVGQSYTISTSRGDNPKLRAKILSDGRESLYLEYYVGYSMAYNDNTDKMQPKVERHKEKLKLYLWHNPRTPIQTQENKDTLELAKKIRNEKDQQLKEQEMGYRLPKKRSAINFHEYFQTYLDNYKKKDRRMIQIAMQRFKDFLRDTPEYDRYQKKIAPTQITNIMILDFVEYLKSRSIGEGAKSIYQRFKKVYKACAMQNDFNFQKPFLDSNGKSISIVIDDNAIVKDFLSPNEEKLLMATHYLGENPQIRKAFIMCLNTGMRFCDVKDLTYGNFDMANGLLTYDQNKTKGHSSNSKVIIPINETIIGLIGDVTKHNKDDLVFSLPSHTMCLKALRRWTARAGITKHITWHCGRHSFGTNMAATAAQKGISIRVVQELMGHSNLRYTERYTRVMDEQKKQAMAELSKTLQMDEQITDK